MKKLFLLLLPGLWTVFAIHAQSLNFETAVDDPLQARIYTLDNGLKVYITVNKAEPRMQTYIAVKAGSKNDPSHATGLAHYLEHMLFKGTDSIGTINPVAEQKLISQIENLYEAHRDETDPVTRKRIYRQIDSISQIAAEYAVTNEYWKLLKGMGAKGINAYTFVEQTVYTVDIPSNQFEKWVRLEAERFRNPVFRLFHTELEAVYEEKNRTLDSDNRQVNEKIYALLFPNHNYGLQTTIGTVEHLKNPSLKAIGEYYRQNYVPNNMAIAISGDVDPTRAVKIINKYFGKFAAKDVQTYTFDTLPPLEENKYAKVSGPDAEFIELAWRFPGAGTREADLLELTTAVLYNSKAGLIDLDLNQKQRVLSGAAYSSSFNDYSLMGVYGESKESQSLDEVKELLLGQIQRVKEGDFPDWLPEAVVRNKKLSHLITMENNRSRAHEFVNSFVTDVSWQRYTTRYDRMGTYSKEDIVEFANDYLNHYVEVRKLTGEKSNKVTVEKPEITPVPVNSEASSVYAERFTKILAAGVQPVFLDYQKDMSVFTFAEGAEVLYKRNTQNDYFMLSYVFETGRTTNPYLGLAARYLKYLGTNEYTAEQLKNEFYKLGVNVNVSGADERTYFQLTGLQENYDEGVALFEHWLRNAEPNEEIYRDFVKDIVKEREDDKKSKSTILRALASYGKYGPASPFKNIVSENELNDTGAEDMVRHIKDLLNHSHFILYYGPASDAVALATVKKHHRIPEGGFAALPARKTYELQEPDQPEVFYVDYDMQQVELMYLYPVDEYNEELLPAVTVFNSYFVSKAFQELRESKALAYSTYGYISKPDVPTEHLYMNAYIGAQADKLVEAAEGMSQLIRETPFVQQDFENERTSLIENLSTSRISRYNVLFDYLDARRLGHDHDVRRRIYDESRAMTMEQLQEFYQEYVQTDQPNVILVIGDREKINEDALTELGNVNELSLEEIFGY